MLEAISRDWYKAHSDKERIQDILIGDSKFLSGIRFNKKYSAKFDLDGTFERTVQILITLYGRTCRNLCCRRNMTKSTV